MSNDNDSQEKAFDWFELLTALLLGLAAVGAAWAGFQGGQWGGRQAEAFGEAAMMTTKAANDYSESVADINQDYTVDLQAKKTILEAMDEEDEKVRAKKFEIASNLYSRYLSGDAYENLGLPADGITPDHAPGKDADYQEAKVLPEKELIDSVEAELDDEYVKDMLASPTAAFEAAQKRFAEGREANETGDKFSLDQVIYTISLFFAGLGLVFKTRIRWGFFLTGFVVFVYATVFLFRIPWA